MDSKEKNKKNNWKNPHFYASLQHAFNGIRIILKEEKNLQRHAVLGIVPLLFAWYFHSSVLEWVIILLCIFLVIIMEFLNTIFENVVDLITDYRYHPLAKKAKDIAAGAVLVTAAFTVAIAAIIFLPKIWVLIYR